MIVKWSAEFNDKENYCLTERSAELENPRSAHLSSYSKISPVPQFCDAPRMHDVSELIVDSHARRKLAASGAHDYARFFALDEGSSSK